MTDVPPVAWQRPGHKCSVAPDEVAVRRRVGHSEDRRNLDGVKTPLCTGNGRDHAPFHVQGPERFLEACDLGIDFYDLQCP